MQARPSSRTAARGKAERARYADLLRQILAEFHSSCKQEGLRRFGTPFTVLENVGLIVADNRQGDDPVPAQEYHMDVRAGMLQHVAFLTAGPPTLLYTGGNVCHFLVLDERS